MNVSHKAPLGLGLSSTVIGAIALALFALPILSIPLAAIGLLLAIAGLVPSIYAGRAVGWPVAGIVVAGAALGISVAIAKAPSYSPPPPAIASEYPLGQPFVAPPARPGR